MQIFNLTFKTLFSGRIQFITYVAICCFGLSLLAGLIPDFWHLVGLEKSLVNILSSLLLGIGTSTLAAALISTFEVINITKVGNLIKMFSIDITKKTVIVIPRFDKEYFNSQDNIEPKTPNEITFISYADFTTAKFLVALFQEHNLGVPEIITDDEALEMIGNEEKIKRYKNFISLGLYSNNFSQKINLGTLENRFFEFSNRDANNPGSRILKYSEPTEPNKIKERIFTPDNQDCSDLAIISKIDYKLESKKFLSIVILGGLNATGTKLLGEYIYKYWDKLLCRCVGRNKLYEQKPILGERNFCVIFKANGIQNVRYDENAVLQQDASYSRVG